jgi:hypothetical protein
VGMERHELRDEYKTTVMFGNVAVAAFLKNLIFFC